jgi:putative flippase GtrA
MRSLHINALPRLVSVVPKSDSTVGDASSVRVDRKRSEASAVWRGRLGHFLLFGLNGAVTAIVYSIAVWSLIAISPRTFAADVVTAYAVAVGVNYLGARLLFRPTSRVSGHIVRYAAVVCLNFAITAAIAWLLHRAGARDAVAAYAPVLITAVPTYVLMRRWVFAPRSAGH